MMIELVRSHTEAIRHLCERHHVRRLWLFGSATDGSFDPQRSDFDFLVEYKPNHENTAWDDYWGLREGLEALFNRRVDLVDRDAMRNPYVIRSVEASREIVYAA